MITNEKALQDKVRQLQAELEAAKPQIECLQAIKRYVGAAHTANITDRFIHNLLKQANIK